jgi:transposase-like protein
MATAGTRRPTRKGCPNRAVEFKREIAAAACAPGISVAKLALERSVDANLLFTWRREYRLDAFHAWLAATLRTVSAKSDLAGAIKYALVRWTALTRYRDDGRIEIDNNSAERSIRPVALGRRNYLFAGSDAGGERAACIYSLIGSALLNGHDPYLYLRHVLERIAEHPINRIDELLPWRVTLEMPARRCA